MKRNPNRVRRNGSAEAAAAQGQSPHHKRRSFQRLRVWMPAELRQRVEAMAARFGGTAGELMECAVFHKLAGSGSKLSKSHLTDGAQRLLARVEGPARRSA